MSKIYNGEKIPQPITRARHVLKLWRPADFYGHTFEELAGMIAEEIRDAVFAQYLELVDPIKKAIFEEKVQIEECNDYVSDAFDRTKASDADYWIKKRKTHQAKLLALESVLPEKEKI